MGNGDGWGERGNPTAKASGLTPFSMSETLRESWVRLRLVFWMEMLAVELASRT